MRLAWAGFSATAYLQVGSVLGVLTGGFLGDRLARRCAGGRMMTQALGLFLGVPFIFLTGWTLFRAGPDLSMFGFGFFKGLVRRQPVGLALRRCPSRAPSHGWGS